MAGRLKEADRVRSVYLYEDTNVTTAVPIEAVLMSHAFQDDIVVIGCELTLKALTVDAHLNADLYLIAANELSRQGTRLQPGAIARVDISTGWSGILGPGGGMSESKVVMFPVGKGIEIDEGEALHLLGYYNYIGAGGILSMEGRAIVWYTER